MDYDVLILGGGIVGCAVAYELSKYSLNIALIEKEYDIADDVALINNAVIYDGLECDNNLMAELEMQGNIMLDETAEKLDVFFQRKGSIMIAQNDFEEKKLKKIYDRAIKRGIENIALLSEKYVKEIEPGLNIKIKTALYSKNTAVISPYDLALAYGEVAFDNNVIFKLEERVLDIKKISKGFKVITSKNKFTCKIVINTTPEKNYSIDNNNEEIDYVNRSKLRYFLLDEYYKNKQSNIIFLMNKMGSRVYTIPTIDGNIVAAVNSLDSIDYEESLEKINLILDNISEEDINSYFESPFYNDNIIIDDNSLIEGYIKIIGKHYGQVTMTPCIAKMIRETVVNNLNCTLKKDYVDKRREYYKFKELNNEERNKIINMDKRYGKMVCICNQITEGEIIDAIRRPLGARTIEGIKRRTGAMLGNCKGCHCMTRIASILSRETGKDMAQIVKDSKQSNIVVSRIKEFEGM